MPPMRTVPKHPPSITQPWLGFKAIEEKRRAPDHSGLSSFTTRVADYNVGFDLSLKVASTCMRRS